MATVTKQHPPAPPRPAATYLIELDQMEALALLEALDTKASEAERLQQCSPFCRPLHKQLSRTMYT